MITLEFVAIKFTYKLPTLNFILAYSPHSDIYPYRHNEDGILKRIKADMTSPYFASYNLFGPF